MAGGVRLIISHMRLAVGILAAVSMLVLIAGGSVAKGEVPEPAILVPHHIRLLEAPRPLAGLLHGDAGFAFLDGAGIVGADSVAGAISASNMVHLEDPLVCGLPCLVNASSLGDEGTLVFCPPAGDPNMPWHWSSGITAPGIAGCTTTAQGAWFVNTNGFVGAQSPACSSTTGNCYTPVSIPTTGAPNGQVYANWQDLDNSCSVAPNGFYVGYGGTSPNRYIIFEWYKVKNYPCASSTNSQTFEVIVFERTNEAQVYYGTGTQTVNATGGQENSAGNAGLQYFRTAAVPQTAAIVYYDGKAPVISAINATCGVAGSNGWCRSASVSAKITDNNDVGFAGRIGMGMATRTRALDGGAAVNYTNNTAFNLSLADGVHTLVANASDFGLNVASLSGSVKVDATLPSFEPKADVVVEATGPNGAIASYNPPVAIDATSGPGAVSCSPASGTQFALGSTTITCTVSDLAGNGPVSTSFLLRVLDTTAPSVDPHANVTAEATGPNGAPVAYTAPASHDAVSGDGTATCAPASDSVFALGTTTVSCSATDAAGNVGSGNFSVIVIDTTPPTVDARADVSAEATSASGAAVTFTSPASHDLVDGDGSSTCAPASGSTFSLGSTLVTCTKTDAAGNTGSSTFHVQVVDTTPPTIDGHGNEVAEATSAAGASVSYTAPATHDLVDGNGTATCAPASGGTFAVGETIVECNAADAQGNAATPKTFKVTVVDTTPPTIAAHADLLAEATSPSGTILSFSAPTTSDLVDGSGFATCAPASGSLFAVGETTVTCTATDAHGNAAVPTHFKVRVTLEIRVSVRTDRSLYDIREALTQGVHGVARVTTSTGAPLEDQEVLILIERVVPVIGRLDNATITAYTDANGEVRFDVPVQFGLPGDYVVTATSVTSGFVGSDSTTYTVGVVIGPTFAILERRSI